jgi:hypothetical protein
MFNKNNIKFSIRYNDNLNFNHLSDLHISCDVVTNDKKINSYVLPTVFQPVILYTVATPNSEVFGYSIGTVE